MTSEPRCKHPGCLEPPVDQRGMYALLCEFHKNQKKHDRANAAKRAVVEEEPDEEPAANGNGSHLDAAERFLAAARALDEAEHAYAAALEAVSRGVK